MPPEGGVHGKPNDKCAKKCRRYVGSTIWRRSVKKNPGKTSRGKTTGGLLQPSLGCIRVKYISIIHMGMQTYLIINFTRGNHESHFGHVMVIMCKSNSINLSSGIVLDVESKLAKVAKGVFSSLWDKIQPASFQMILHDRSPLEVT